MQFRLLTKKEKECHQNFKMWNKDVKKGGKIPYHRQSLTSLLKDELKVRYVL